MIFPLSLFGYYLACLCVRVAAGWWCRPDILHRCYHKKGKSRSKGVWGVLTVKNVLVGIGENPKVIIAIPGCWYCLHTNAHLLSRPPSRTAKRQSCQTATWDVNMYSRLDTVWIEIYYFFIYLFFFFFLIHWKKRKNNNNEEKRKGREAIGKTDTERERDTVEGCWMVFCFQVGLLRVTEFHVVDELKDLNFGQRSTH